ncbi:MAG: alcohol dehydrogenase catalytic domain-containing protein [Candidatus Levybacteria bacterium]|nr:alcohol dehydrogenase catalytic domain-containing protein [Candidatus Levybacteria bacterium]
MLAVVKDKRAPGVSIKQIDIPKPQKDEVLVKVIHASICGTDIGIYDWIPWAQGHIKPPIVIGHEVVGEVIEINSRKKTKIKKGDLVSSETHIFCLNCYQCKIKNYQICQNLQLFGIGRNGGFAQYATIPLRTTWKNDKSIPVEAMSVQEPLGNAVNVVTKAEVKGKKVLVMGLGPTGLCAGMVAKAYGASEVVGVNRREYRRKLALKLGLDRAVGELDPKEYGSFDAVLEMSGNRIGIQVAFDSVKIGGKIIAFGIPKEEISFDWGKYLINKELLIDSVFGRMIWNTWEEATKLLVSKKVDLRKTITHKFKLKDFDEAMKVMKSGECGKILLTP